jgi:hypothetical protein
LKVARAQGADEHLPSGDELEIGEHRNDRGDHGAEYIAAQQSIGPAHGVLGKRDSEEKRRQRQKAGDRSPHRRTFERDYRYQRGGKADIVEDQ